MAYKSVEIDQGLMKDEIFYFRKKKWEIRENIFNYYDFGLLWMDAQPFKKGMIEHCEKLETHLCNYVKQEFVEKKKQVQLEINMVVGRLNEKVTSIDDVIALLDYIETLKRQDNKVEEIADFIDTMVR